MSIPATIPFLAAKYLIENHFFPFFIDTRAYRRRMGVAGWSSLVARRAHNPKVVGSNPAPATRYRKRPLFGVAFFVCASFKFLIAEQISIDRDFRLRRMAGAGWSSLVARRAHNPKVVGSNPAPATRYRKRPLFGVAFFVCASFKFLIAEQISIDRDFRLRRMAGAGWSSLVARRAHNPKVVGSNPAPATRHRKRPLFGVAFFVCARFKLLIENEISFDTRLHIRRIAAAGWSSLVARRAHNPKVVGSNPAPATRHRKRPLFGVAFFVCARFKLLIENEISFDTRLHIRRIAAAGWSSLVARRAHNPKVVGSNPAPATRHQEESHS